MLITDEPIELTRIPAGWDAIFVGTVRGASNGEEVTDLCLDHHPILTESSAAWIQAEAVRRFGLTRAFFLHRVGSMAVGETIVVLAAWAASRTTADEACRWMLETTKRSLPVWKAEATLRGPRWVQGKPIQLEGWHHA